MSTLEKKDPGSQGEPLPNQPGSPKNDPSHHPQHQPAPIIPIQTGKTELDIDTKDKIAKTEEFARQIESSTIFTGYSRPGIGWNVSTKARVVNNLLEGAQMYRDLAAKSEVERLRSDQLQQDVEQLKRENSVLKEENKNFSRAYDFKDQAAKNLEEAVESISKEYERLESALLQISEILQKLNLKH